MYDARLYVHFFRVFRVVRIFLRRVKLRLKQSLARGHKNVAACSGIWSKLERFANKNILFC